MGGAVGHVQHLHENRSLSFGELKQILFTAADGNLQKASEKLDGLNLVFTWNIEEATLKVARSITDIKKGGLTARQLSEKFAGRGTLHEAFTSASKILLGAIGCLTNESLQKLFGRRGNRWYSIEVIHTLNPNVINYDSNTIAFHGWPIFQLEANGSVQHVDNPKCLNELSSSVDKMQKAVALHGWKIKGPAILRLNKIADRSIVKEVIEQIDLAQQQAGLNDAATIQQYLTLMLQEDVDRIFPTYKNSLKRMIVERCLESDGCPSLTDIKKNSNKSDHGSIVEFVGKSPAMLRAYIRPIELAINSFAVELLKGLHSSLVNDGEGEVRRLREETSKAIKMIESSGDDKAQHVMKEQLEKLGSLSNISTTVEGVVFFWKGHAYKFSGSFAAVGQILGLFRYGRNGAKPLILNNAL